MKSVLLPLFITALAPAAHAAMSTASLNNQSFVLQASVNGQSQCLSRGFAPDATFVECFSDQYNNDEERAKAFKQMVIYQNKRLYAARGFGSAEQECLRASSKSEVSFSTDCNDTNSVFEVLPVRNTISDNTTARFLLRNTRFFLCLNPSGSVTNKLADCNTQRGELFLNARLYQPLVEWRLSNKNKNGRDVTIEYREGNGSLVFSKTLNNIKYSREYSVLIPDYQSYLQTPMTVTVKTDNPRFGEFNSSTAFVRSPSGANVWVNSNKYSLVSTSNLVPSVEMASYGASPQIITYKEESFNFVDDQSSLNPFFAIGGRIPDGWVVAFFDGEFFTPKDNLYRNMQIGFGGFFPQGGNIQSARILYKNEGETFKITNNQGGLTWRIFSQGTPSAALSYGGIVDGDSASSGERANISGPFARLTSHSKAWRVGSIFCEAQGEPNRIKAPSCAMLKTATEASRIFFDNTAIWQAFPIKAYQSKKAIVQGEIFYRGSSDNWELWYAKSSGNLAAIPANKTSNANWQYMGLYEDLLIR